MEWTEAKPLPAQCQNCKDSDCYNCDHAAQRWYISHRDELQLRRKSILQAMTRLQRQLDRIDRELELLEEVP